MCKIPTLVVSAHFFSSGVQASEGIHLCTRDRTHFCDLPVSTPRSNIVALLLLWGTIYCRNYFYLRWAIYWKKHSLPRRQSLPRWLPLIFYEEVLLCCTWQGRSKLAPCSSRRMHVPRSIKPCPLVLRSRGSGSCTHHINVFHESDPLLPVFYEADLHTALLAPLVPSFGRGPIFLLEPVARPVHPSFSRCL